VPIGVPGELYVGGAGVGRGYLNRPELTAERFIPNPFRPGAGKRLYRSGDLVRYLPNRDLEYRGRIDAQIKIRGFRIELGEIEAVLRQHAAVREVVVLAREDSGEKRLVAYVVPAQQAPTVSELNGFLRQKLPEYMVPSAFMFLDALPLTANGKIDRRNLPGPDQSRPEQESSFVAPRTPVEELLAQIWAEVLKLDQVGIHDNFFELGGHSLLLTQVASRIQRAFLVLLPLRILFDAPTIADLSAAIAAAQLEQEDAAEVARIVEELKQLSADEVADLLEKERRSHVSDSKQ
jgi:acyl carrier protein